MILVLQVSIFLHEILTEMVSSGGSYWKGFIIFQTFSRREGMLKKLRCQQMVLLCGVKSMVFSRLIFHFMEIHPNCHSSVIDQPRNWIFYTLWKVFLSGKSCSLWRIALCIQVAFFYSTFAVFLPVYAKNTFRKRYNFFLLLKNASDFDLSRHMKCSALLQRKILIKSKRIFFSRWERSWKNSSNKWIFLEVWQ